MSTPTATNDSTRGSMIRRLSSAAARRVSNIFTDHGPDLQQIGTALEKVREWRDADDVELEDVLYGIVGHDVNDKVFPPAPYSVPGSEALFTQYRSKIGKINSRSLVTTLDPSQNQNIVGPPSKARSELWSRFSEAKKKQDRQLNGATTARTFALASSTASIPVPQIVWDNLDASASLELNRHLAQSMAELVEMTLDEQDEWLKKEGEETERGSSVTDGMAGD